MSKSDVCEENYAEKEDQATESFKMACINFGIGRELYTAPFIWVGAEDVNLNDGELLDKLSVHNIDVTNGVITDLSIADETTRRIVFDWRL